MSGQPGILAAMFRNSIGKARVASQRPITVTQVRDYGGLSIVVAVGRWKIIILSVYFKDTRRKRHLSTGPREG